MTLVAQFYTSQKVIDKLIENITDYLSNYEDDMYNAEIS